MKAVGVDLGGTKMLTRVSPDEPGRRSPTPEDEQGLLGALEKAGVSHADAICFAIAGPPDGDLAALTNHPLRFRPEAVASALDIDRWVVVNDLHAAAEALTVLDDGDYLEIAAGPLQGAAVIAGIGTGLGVALRSESGLIVPGEGGHVSLPVTSPEELEILEGYRREIGRVSVERVVSGTGLSDLARVMEGVEISSEQIMADWRSGEVYASRVLDAFLRFAGTFFGDLCLIGGSSAGLWITGGIPSSAPELFDRGVFLEAFQDKGRFSDWIARVPIRVVTRSDVVALGAFRVAENTC